MVKDTTDVDVTKLDEVVLRAVTTGAYLMALVRQDVARKGLEASHRDVDRSLQRLRKAGKIKYEPRGTGGAGWVPTK